MYEISPELIFWEKNLMVISCLHIADLTPPLVKERLDQDNRLRGVRDK